MDNSVNSVDKWGDFVDKSESKFLFSKKDIATIFDVDEKAVYKWVTQNGCPTKMVGKSKKYDIREVIKWRNENTGSFIIDDEGKISSLPIKEQIYIYKRDELEAKSKLKDLEFKIKNGEYLPKEEVIANYTNGLAVFKKSLLNLANKVVSLISTHIPHEEHREIADEIEGLTKDCLNNLSKGDEYV